MTAWDCGRINGELRKLGCKVHRQTVRRVMLDHGLGLDYCRPIEPDAPATTGGEAKCHERLGGLLKSYYREAA